ncbi:host cell division inhibitor Icd-like protein [Serratia sp. IR-2025]
MLDGVTIMADTQSTQTRPKYHFRFLAIARINPAATPCRLSVEAATEQEARLSLVRLYILSLAARLPVQEVAHA